MKRPLLALVGLLVLPLVGCSDNSTSTDDSGAIAVTSSNDACIVEPTEVPSGTLVFSVTNTGDEATEFYLLGDDETSIVAEVENIGPGISRDLVVEATPGTYFTACKPGMTGDGIRAEFTVTGTAGDSAPSGPYDKQLQQATASYAAYAKGQTKRLVGATKSFAASYVAGDDDKARKQYAPARVYWERIEPIAESFGDIDPKLDLREADLAPGQKWTGWHAIEKDLWPPNDYRALTQRQREAVAHRLVADTAELSGRVATVDLSADQLGNGAKELLDEVATGKVTGEEEFWSHTDLWDFQANIDGARVAYKALRPVVRQQDTELAATLDERFASLQRLLNKYRVGGGFVLYTDLTPQQVKELAAGVDALGEPLSHLTATVLR